MDVIKKPYEISLWDDRLYWVRKPLKEKTDVNKENYKPGIYYSQNANNSNNSPFTLDHGVFVDGRKYYIIDHDVKLSPKEGPDITYTDLNESDRDWRGIKSTVFSYYKEIKLCIIGSNTMSSPIRATKPKLVSKVNGENTFTFTMYSQYWDEQANQLQWNPFMMYLTNERKVKLKYDKDDQGNDIWYDFIIKNINEDSASKAFTYTCKDLFVNELSKTGFELEFDNELGNNMGTLPELAGRILKGSDWQLKENIKNIKQYLEEPLYLVTLNQQITAFRAYGKDDDGEAAYDEGITITKNSKIYIFYSSVNNKSSRLEFLYDPSGKYPKGDDNVIFGYDEDDNSDGVSNYYVESVTWEDRSGSNLPNKPNIASDIEFVSTLRGKRLIRSQKTYFDPKLKRTVNIYDDGEVYGYTSTKYISPNTVQSYITNPSDFTSTTGWSVGKAASTDSFPKLELKVYPEMEQLEVYQPYSFNETSFKAFGDTIYTYNDEKEEYEKAVSYVSGTEYFVECQSYLKFTPSASKQVLMNSGIFDHRSTIKSFMKGEKYILKKDILNALPNQKANGDIKLAICEYTYSEGVYKLDNNKLFDEVTLSSNNDEVVLTVQYSISEEDLKKKKIGVFLIRTSNSPFYVKNLQLYKKFVKEDGNNATPEDGENSALQAQVKVQWNYYSEDANYTSEEDLEYLYQGEEEQTVYIPYYGDEENPAEQYEKVRSITAKESNRFNLLQSLSETFECWAQFSVDHTSSGEIELDENYRQKKWVTYKQYIGQDNHVGFKYGINLKSIKRTLDSSGAISKIIVKDNANEFAPGGFCSISRAQENVSGENTIYNFDYYVGQGLINFSMLNNDLYFQPGNAQGYLGYYKSLKAINTEAQEQAEVLARLVNDISNYDSQYQTYKYSSEAATEDLHEQQLKFRDLTSVEFSDALPEFQKYDESKHKPATGATGNWWEEQGLLWEFYKGSDKTKKVDSAPTVNDYARLKWWDNKEAQKIRAAIARDVVVEKDHKAIYERQLSLKTANEAKLVQIEARLKEIREQKLNINLAFYKKYSRFIQEGSWIKEDYIDDNLYYIDALSTLYTSSRPKVTYTIDVIELSQVAGYENFKFALGDKTYIEDKEFFGWAYDGSKRPYREEVIVSEVAWELDSPESNKIKVQNYKTQFEDLFQRVVATTQQVQFSTGEYKRSAAIVEPGGTINATSLQNSFLNNAITLQNAKDQSVIIGDDGITTTNLSRPSEILRIVSGGIFLSSNGGESWTTGISAGGINANCITTGQINASEINITMGSNTTFRWDQLGISAYKKNKDTILPSVFTRFDQYGIYGIDGDSAFDASVEEAGVVGLNKIKKYASFGLTWDGFWLKSKGTDGYVSISSDKDLEVVRVSEGREIPIIQLGRLLFGDDSYYGLRINDTSGDAVMETNSNGELWLKKKLSILTNNKIYNETDKDYDDESHTVELGFLGLDKDYLGSNKVIDVNGKFKVFENGHIEGTDAHFSGGSTFEGEITATGGTIGGLRIEEWQEMGYSVQIESSTGWVQKNQFDTVLTANFYKGTELCNKDTDIIKVKDSEGNEIEYKINYQWYRDDLNGEEEVSIINGNSKTIEVKLEGSQPDSIKYRCQITLTSEIEEEEERDEQ